MSATRPCICRSGSTTPSVLRHPCVTREWLTENGARIDEGSRTASLSDGSKYTYDSRYSHWARTF